MCRLHRGWLLGLGCWVGVACTAVPRDRPAQVSNHGVGVRGRAEPAVAVESATHRAATPIPGDMPATAVHWRSISDAAGLARAAQEAQAQGRLLLVDVRADWCMPCRELERRTFADPQVAQLLADDVVAVRFDVTDPDAAAKALQTALGASTLPTVVMYRPGAQLAQTVVVASDTGVPAVAPDLLITKFVTPEVFAAEVTKLKAD